MSPIPRLEVRGGDIGAVVLLLPGPTATVDGDGQDDESDKHDAGTDGTSNPGVVEERTNNGSGTDLSEPVQEAVQGTSAGVKVGGVDGILLVGVEPVGRPHHGEQQDDVGLGNNAGVQTLDFRPPAGVLHENDFAAVVSDDLVGIDEEKSQDRTGSHQDNESDVGTVIDSLGDLHVDVLTQWDQTTDTSTDVENRPEPSPVATLLSFSWVRHHDDTLSSPQDTGANTKPSTGKDVEAGHVVMNGREQRAGVDAVTDTTETNGVANTETVDNSSSQETHDGKGGV